MSAITGIIGASYVPTEWGLEFTGTLALVALVGPSLNARPAVVGAAVAAVVALIAYPLPFKLGLFCGAIAGIVAATLADRWQQRGRRGPRRPHDRTRRGIALAVVIVGLALSTFVTRTSFLLAGAKLALGAASKSRCVTRRCARSPPSSCPTS